MGGGSGTSTSPVAGMVASAPGLMTSSPYVQPWAANAAGTPPPTGYDQPAPNPTASTYTSPLSSIITKGTAVVPELEMPRTTERYIPNKVGKSADKGFTYAGELVANASATGGAYGMPATSYGGGPAYKNAAGKYFYDKEGKYPIPAEHIRLGGGGLK